MDKKKLIIIGGGIAGLTSGIYALDNGMDVTILEKHTIPGGECTGWMRKGTYIDGCAHWIVGTNPKSQLFPMWKHVGAFDENTTIYPTEYFKKVDINGEIITLYADLKLLEEELYRVAPDDKKVITRFIKGIKAYRHVSVPVNKPIDMMNLFELTAFGCHFIPMLKAYLRYFHKSVNEFVADTKSPVLKEAIRRILGGEYNMHSLLYVMQALSLNDAGMVEGGSLKMALRIADRYTSKGGKIRYSSSVKKINVENKKVVNVELENGEIIEGDYFISTADAHHTLYDLLEGKFKDDFYDKRFADPKNHPLNQSLQVSFRCTKDCKDLPKMIDFAIEPIQIGSVTVKNLSLRNHSFDQTLSKDSTSLTVLIQVFDDIYESYKKMDKDEYLAEKMRIGNHLLKEIKRYLNFCDDEIELLDMTTPLTYERYCNAYHGSYMSFITTHKQEKLMGSGLIKGINNFFLAGQWVMPPGGLPIALFTGKHAIYRICRKEHKKFIHE